MNQEFQRLNNFFYSNTDLTEEEQRQLEEYLGVDNNELGGRNYNAISTNESSGEENVVPSDESDFDESDNEPLANIRFTQYSEETPQECEAEFESLAIGPNLGEKYVGQGRGNGTVWWSQSSGDERMRTQHAKNTRIHSIPIAKEQYSNKIDVFKDIFSNSLVETIVLETNRKARRVYAEISHTNAEQSLRYWRDTNVAEIYAYIAIILYAGAEKSNLVQAKDLFDKKNMPFYRAVMALYRFEQLSRFLRFDDSRTRVDRLHHDKLAPIRHIWTLFLSSIKMHYQPSKELCIDEQLLSTRNKCSFRQYIPSKPGKYGIKIFWLVDAKSNYPLVGEIYLGMQPDSTRSTGVAYDLVKRLSNSYVNHGYNITMDNFFTSYKLANDLVQKDTTIVGTIRSNKPELPKIFTSAEEAKKRGAFSSVFCYSKAVQLTSFTTHSSKNVLLLSSAHATDRINEKTRKPEVIHDYNKTKGGVDTFDKMVRAYSCKRKCNRWPMAIFFNMVDAAALASYRLFELCNPGWNSNRAEKRKIFLKELARDLAENHLQSKKSVNATTKIAMDLIGFKYQNAAQPRLPVTQTNMQKKRCDQCRKEKKDNKTTAVCDLCKTPTCSKHFVRACEMCYQSKFIPETDTDSDDNQPTTSAAARQRKRSRRHSPIN